MHTLEFVEAVTGLGSSTVIGIGVALGIVCDLEFVGLDVTTLVISSSSGVLDIVCDLESMVLDVAILVIGLGSSDWD